MYPVPFYTMLTVELFEFGALFWPKALDFAWMPPTKKGHILLAGVSPFSLKSSYRGPIFLMGLYFVCRAHHSAWALPLSLLRGPILLGVSPFYRNLTADHDHYGALFWLLYFAPGQLWLKKLFQRPILHGNFCYFFSSLICLGPIFIEHAQWRPIIVLIHS